MNIDLETLEKFLFEYLQLEKVISSEDDYWGLYGSNHIAISLVVAIYGIPVMFLITLDEGYFSAILFALAFPCFFTFFPWFGYYWHYKELPSLKSLEKRFKIYSELKDKLDTKAKEGAQIAESNNLLFRKNKRDFYNKETKERYKIAYGKLRKYN